MSRRKIPLENLKIWQQAAAENRALRLLQITEMAKEMPLDDTEERQNHSLPAPALSCEVELPFTECFARTVALDEQMTLCHAMRAKNAPFRAADEAAPMPTAPRVARLAGKVFDSAFQRLLPRTAARPLYVSTLGELLEELAAGNADLAIFPIEDAKGVRFLHFYEEFDRLELRITHVCDVSSEENDRLGFALLSKQYAPDVQGAQMLEYRISGREQGALAQLLTAAEYAGLTLPRVDSVPDPYFEDGFVYHVVLRVGQGDAALLHDYLSLSLPYATQVGAYIYLER